MKQKKYTIFWFTGQCEIVEGTSIADAANKAGIGRGAISEIDFYEQGDKSKSYIWNKEERTWKSC